MNIKNIIDVFVDILYFYLYIFRRMRRYLDWEKLVGNIEYLVIFVVV